MYVLTKLDYVLICQVKEKENVVLKILFENVKKSEISTRSNKMA